MAENTSAEGTPHPASLYVKAITRRRVLCQATKPLPESGIQRIALISRLGIFPMLINASMDTNAQ